MTLLSMTLSSFNLSIQYFGYAVFTCCELVSPNTMTLRSVVDEHLKPCPNVTFTIARHFPMELFVLTAEPSSAV